MNPDIGFGAFLAARIGTAALVLAMIGASPWQFGRIAEGRFHATLAEWANDSGWRVADSRFERGWLRSRGHAELVGPGPGGLRISAEHEVAHGPWPLSSLSDWRDLLRPMIARAESIVRLHTPARSAIVEGNSVLGIDGGLRTDFAAFDDSIELAHYGGRLQWAGLSGRWRSGRAGEPRHLTVTAASVSWPADHVASHRLEDVRIDSVRATDGDAIRIRVHFSRGSTSGARLENGEIEVLLQGRPGTARPFAPRDTATTDAVPFDPGRIAESLLARLAGNGTRFSVLASAVPSQGSGRLELNLAGAPDDEPQASGDLSLPGIVLAQYAAQRVEIELDELQARGLLPALGDAQRRRAVAEAAARRVGEWARAGWLQRDGDTFHARLEVADGHLSLNGLPTLSLSPAP